MSIFEIIGEDGFTRLVAAFYRQVPHDPILGPMYQAHGDLAEAEVRLRDFLIYRFGGSERYIATRGAPRLRIRHAPFVVDNEARDHWAQMMDQALLEADLPADAADPLRQFFHETATFLINQR